MPPTVIPDDDATIVNRPTWAAMVGPTAAALDAGQLGHLAAINPIVAAANPLLMAIPSLRSGAAPADVEVLRSGLIQRLEAFDGACRTAGVGEEPRSLAQYALCTVLDEVIQQAPWSHAAEWPRRSLTLHVFSENLGGEAFFAILDDLLVAPSKFPQVLQLYFICLALGFMGKYLARDAAGRAEIRERRERIYQQLIRPQFTDPSNALSPQWEGLSVAARQFKGFGPLWIAITGTVLACLLLYLGLRWSLADALQRTGLERLALKPLVVERAAPPAQTPPTDRPRLKQLLAREEAAGLVLVDESTPATPAVTLADNFDSGSATPSAAAASLAKAVAKAIDRIPGRVEVTGYTDNRPTRPPPFANNFMLSEARAGAVAELIRAELRDPSRVSAVGRGEVEPIGDNRTEQGRGANRRVVVTVFVSPSE